MIRSHMLLAATFALLAFIDTAAAQYYRAYPYYAPGPYRAAPLPSYDDDLADDPPWMSGPYDRRPATYRRYQPPPRSYGRWEAMPDDAHYRRQPPGRHDMWDDDEQDIGRLPPNRGRGAALAALPPDFQAEEGTRELPPRFRRQTVEFRTKEPAGSIVIDTERTYLYYVLGNGQAIRYGIGVGREGFTWSGKEKISRMAEWPDWYPPKDMIERQPYLPRMMSGGPGNPLGARALYLGKTLYRIHGTNQPSTIGQFVSSGCIRMLNEDVEDLYSRVRVGTPVVVLSGRAPASARSAERTRSPTAR